METLDGHAAIHTNDLAGYVSRRLACKEGDRGRDILGSAERAERDARDRAFADLSPRCAVMSVSMNPGATAFTVT